MFDIMIEESRYPPLLIVEYKNVRPVDLIDLGHSFRAFGENFADFVYEQGLDPRAGNVRLFVHRLSTGSILGELTPYLDQANLLLDHAKTLVPYVEAFRETAHYFLGVKGKTNAPSRRSAEQVHAILEPTAQDDGSKLIIGTVNGSVFNNCTFTPQDANGIQNGAKRLLAPSISADQPMTDQVLTLHQVRGDMSLQSVDRGVIASVSPRDVKLSFASREAKIAIVGTHANPFKMGYLVDVDVKSHNGKPALYLVREVKASFDLPD